jgi:pilus assembly protein Flp/PilA
MLNRIAKFAWQLLVKEDGPTAVEYAVMMMLIFLACIATIQIVGDSTSSSFENSKDSIVNTIQNAQSS